MSSRGWRRVLLGSSALWVASCVPDGLEATTPPGSPLWVRRVDGQPLNEARLAVDGDTLSVASRFWNDTKFDSAGRPVRIDVASWSVDGAPRLRRGVVSSGDDSTRPINSFSVSGGRGWLATANYLGVGAQVIAFDPASLASASIADPAEFPLLAQACGDGTVVAMGRYKAPSSLAGTSLPGMHGIAVAKLDEHGEASWVLDFPDAATSYIAQAVRCEGSWFAVLTGDSSDARLALTVGEPGALHTLVIEGGLYGRLFTDPQGLTITGFLETNAAFRVGAETFARPEGAASFLVRLDRKLEQPVVGFLPVGVALDDALVVASDRTSYVGTTDGGEPILRKFQPPNPGQVASQAWSRTVVRSPEDARFEFYDLQLAADGSLLGVGLFEGSFTLGGLADGPERALVAAPGGNLWVARWEP